MSKIIIWNLVSLDGFFEGPAKWDLDFHNVAWGEELEALSKEFGKSAAALVFGRVTYEGMKAHWTSAAASSEASEITSFMNALPKIVASRTLKSSDWNNTRVTDDIASALHAAKEKAEPGKNIYVFGSAELCDSLIRAGIVDEVMLGLVPVQLGKGTPFFKPGGEERIYKLLEARPLNNGTLILRYQPGGRD